MQYYSYAQLLPQNTLISLPFISLSIIFENTAGCHSNEMLAARSVQPRTLLCSFVLVSWMSSTRVCQKQHWQPLVYKKKNLNRYFSVTSLAFYERGSTKITVAIWPVKTLLHNVSRITVAIMAIARYALM